MKKHLITTHILPAAALTLLLAACGDVDDTGSGANPDASLGGTQAPADSFSQQGTDPGEPMNSSGATGGGTEQ